MKRYWDKPKGFLWGTRWFVLQVKISGDWLWENTEAATGEKRTHFFTVSSLSRDGNTVVSVIILPLSITFGLV